MSTQPVSPVAVPRPGLYVRYGKRLLDLAGASIALVVAAPVMVVAAGLVRLRMGAPVFFSDLRAGRRGRPFLLRKLRTMTNAIDADGRLLADDRRLTRLGKFLRRTSLDELPELWQVMRGEMSLVGPRPLPVKYLERYSAEQARRLEGTPGLTGLAQVRGRNSLSWDERFALDVWYVDHVSLKLDLTLLLQTALVVLRGDGVSHPGHVTMHEFFGTKPDYK